MDNRPGDNSSAGEAPTTERKEAGRLEGDNDDDDVDEFVRKEEFWCSPADCTGSRLLKTLVRSRNYMLLAFLTKDSYVPGLEPAISRYLVLKRFAKEEMMKPEYKDHPLRAEISQLRDQYKALLDFTKYATADIERLVSYLYYGAFSIEEGEMTGTDKRRSTHIYLDMYLLAQENDVTDLAAYSLQNFVTYLLFPTAQQSRGDCTVRSAKPRNLQLEHNIFMERGPKADQVELWQQTLQYVNNHLDVKYHRGLVRTVVFILMQIKDSELLPLAASLHQYFVDPSWAPELSSCRLFSELGTKCEYCARKKDFLAGCLHAWETCVDCGFSEICRACWWLPNVEKCDGQYVNSQDD